MRPTILLLLAGCSTLAAAELVGPRKEARAVRLPGPIAMDGRLDEAAWKEIPVFTGFQRLLTDPDAGEAIPTGLQTSFQVGHDDTTLYFGVRCNEPEMDKLHPYGVTSQWDAAMWGNDDLEIFLDPVGDRREKYQFAIDPNGAQCDLYFIEGGSTGKPYSAIWQVKTHKGCDFWSAEIAIPFASLHMRPSAMWSEAWVFSLARSRIGGGRQGFTHSKFSPTNRGYHDLANFGTLAGIAVDRSRYNLASEKPAWRLEPAENGFRLHAAFTVRNTAATPFQGELACEVDGVGSRGGTKPLAIPANGTATIAIDTAMVKEQGPHALSVRIADAANQPVLSARYDQDLRYVPLTVRLTRPNYRNGIYATQQIERIAGTIQLGMPPGQVSGCIARVTLGSSLSLPRRVELPIAGSNLSFELPAADLPVGDHTLSVELLRPVPNAKPPQRQHALVAETALPLRRLPPAPDVEVRIDDQGILLIDGHPTMLRGWYGSSSYGMPRSSLPQANLPHSTNFLMFGGGNAIWCLKDLSRLIDEDVAKLDQPLDEGLKTRVRAAMAEVRGRRNVIGYYLADEPCYRAVPASYLKRIYDLLAAEDPYRLVMVVDIAPEDYSKACDAICPHPYQSPLEYADGTRKFGSGLDAIRSCLVRAIQANDGSKAVWTMPQVFSYGGPLGRNPTLAEQRWIMYDGIANGATSLVPFIFCGYWNNHENRIAADAVFEELVLLEPFLTARDAAIPASADLPTIDVAARTAQISKDGWKHTAIVAVSRSYEPCSARITVPALGKATQLLVLRENRVVPVVDGAIRDTFDRLGVHVYTTIEALPHLKTLAELAEAVAAPQRAAAAGNLLADASIHWRLAATGSSYVEGEGSPRADRSFTAGLRDGSGWFPIGKPTGDCVLLFDAPLAFSRLDLTSATIRDADLDIWAGGGWENLHQWKGHLLPRLEWSGPAVTTTRIRIAVKATRRGSASWLTPEIAEMGIYK
jgi:hypothetical protein